MALTLSCRSFGEHERRKWCSSHSNKKDLIVHFHVLSQSQLLSSRFCSLPSFLLLFLINLLASQSFWDFFEKKKRICIFSNFQVQSPQTLLNISGIKHSPSLNLSLYLHFSCTLSPASSFDLQPDLNLINPFIKMHPFMSSYHTFWCVYFRIRSNFHFNDPSSLTATTTKSEGGLSYLKLTLVEEEWKHHNPVWEAHNFETGTAD